MHLIFFVHVCRNQLLNLHWSLESVGHTGSVKNMELVEVKHQGTLICQNLKIAMIKFDSLALRKLQQLMHLHHMFPFQVTFL